MKRLVSERRYYNPQGLITELLFSLRQMPPPPIILKEEQERICNNSRIVCLAFLL